MKRGPSFSLRVVGLLVVLVLLALVVLSSYTIIGPGQRGVVVMLGRVEEGSLPEGFHLVLPPVARQVVPIDVRTKKIEIVTEAASSDLQTIMVTGVLKVLRYIDSLNMASLNMSVYFHLDDDLFTPHLRICPRVNIPPFETSQINYMGMLHNETLTIMKPEDICTGIRQLW